MRGNAFIQLIQLIEYQHFTAKSQYIQYSKYDITPNQRH